MAISNHASMHARRRTAILNVFLVLSYFLTLVNTAGYLRSVEFADIFTGVQAIAVYLTYSLLYLAPAILLTKLVDRLCRSSVKGDMPLGESRATKNWLVFSFAVMVCWATQSVLFADKTVFSIFGMHLNGFVWNTVFTKGGLESMGSDTSTVWTYSLIFAGYLIVQVVLLVAAWKLAILARPWSTTARRRVVVALTSLFTTATIGQGLAYGISDIKSHGPLLATASVFPLYQPITFRNLARNLGFDVETREDFQLRAPSLRLSYPAEPLVVEPPTEPLNIVWLVSESLRADMLDPEIMPRTWAFAERAHRFTRHYSGGNGTRMGMFTMFYGLYGNYWFPFLQENRSPIVMDVLQDQNYQLSLFTSARFTYPEFDRTIFARVPKEQMFEDSLGLGWSRDRRNVGRIIESIRSRDPSRPFMTFLFYESPHARYYFPPESAIRQPYAEDFNYATMDPEDMPLIKNRYINSCNHLDTQIDRVLQFLEEERLIDSTIVLITGDHGEEFMEKGRWGHNSEFSEEQLRTPMVLWIPGAGASVVTRMTSHLDIVPTLLPLLGVRNPADQLSQGVSLLGDESREFTVVADWNRMGYVDDEFKATFPLNIGAGFRNRVTDASDSALDDPSEFYDSRQARLLQIMKELRRFGR